MGEIARSWEMVVPPRAMARATALALLLSALGWTRPVVGQSLPPDSLIEIVAYRIPLRFQVRGAAINDSGTVLYWSDSAAAVVAQNARAIEIVCPRLPRRPIAAAFVSDSSAVEIVDAGSGAVFRRDGDCRQIFPLRAAGGFVSAARTRIGWVLGVVAPSGAGSVVAVDTLGGALWSFSSQAGPNEAWDPRYTHLSAVATGVAFSALRWPFQWLWLAADGSVVARADTASLGRALPGAEQWLGLPLVAVGNSLVQTIADPRSDQRRLVVYRRDGSLVRVVGLNTAMGLLASSPNGRLAVAVRRTDVLEIVVYRWVGPSPEAGGP